MKKQLTLLLLGVAFNSTAFAQDNQSPVNVKGSGAAMEAGFSSWGKSDVTTGGPGGQVLASEANSWVSKSKKIGRI